MSAHLAGYLTPKQARALFPTQPSTVTIRSWMRRGVCDHRVEGGKARIKLQSIVAGSTWYTRADWVQQFIADCSVNHK